MSSPDVTFGPGDYGGYNNWVFSGSNNKWTNWNNSQFTGGPGRHTAQAARWDAYSGFSGGCNGHNGLYQSASPYTKVNGTADYGVGAVGGGTSQTMHNVGVGALYFGSANFYMGFKRDQAASEIFAFQNGTYAGYAGKDADDSDINSGVSNWAGVGSPGGVPVYATYVFLSIYVRRAGAWNQVFPYVWRGSWVNMVVWVYRGSWQYLNALPWTVWMTKGGRHVPARGMPVLVDVGDGLERGWVQEDGPEWFGSVDPSQYAEYFDWRKPGHYAMPLKEPNFRYNSREPQQWVEARQYAADQVRRRLAAGDLREVETWKQVTTLQGPRLTPRGWDTASQPLPAGWLNKTPSSLRHAVSQHAARRSASPILLAPPARSGILSAVGASSTSERT